MAEKKAHPPLLFLCCARRFLRLSSLRVRSSCVVRCFVSLSGCTREREVALQKSDQSSHLDRSQVQQPSTASLAVKPRSLRRIRLGEPTQPGDSSFSTPPFPTIAIGTVSVASRPPRISISTTSSDIDAPQPHLILPPSLQHSSLRIFCPVHSLQFRNISAE